jgi:hypothetical protein
LTIPLGQQDNVATFHFTPGYQKFSAFYAEAEINLAVEQDFPAIYQPADAASDNEGDLANKYSNNKISDSSNEEETSPLCKRFKLDGPRGRDAPVIVEDEEDHQPTNLASEML